MKYSILSNNCWSTLLHQKLQCQYLTPFVNQFIPHDEYCLFLDNIDRVDLMRLEHLGHSDAEQPPSHHQGIDNVLVDELFIVHPIHDLTFEDFKSKWLRRVERIQKDNLLLKISVGEFDTPIDKGIRLYESGRFKKCILTGVGEKFDSLVSTYSLKVRRGYAFSDNLLIQKSADYTNLDMRRIPWTVANWINN